MGGGRCRLILFLLPSRSSRLVLLPLTRRAVGREETGAQANNCPLWDTRSSHSTKVGSVDTSTTERSVPLSGKKHQKSRLQQTASFGYATPQWAAKFDWLPPAGIMADLSFSVFFPVADSISPMRQTLRIHPRRRTRHFYPHHHGAPAQVHAARRLAVYGAPLRLANHRGPRLSHKLRPSRGRRSGSRRQLMAPVWPHPRRLCAAPEPVHLGPAHVHDYQSLCMVQRPQEGTAGDGGGPDSNLG